MDVKLDSTTTIAPGRSSPLNDPTQNPLQPIFDTRMAGQRAGREFNDLFSRLPNDFFSSMNFADEITEKSFMEDPLAWAGKKIDQAVHGAEKAVDGWRKDMVAFGQKHGGVAGEAVASQVADGIGIVEGAGLAVYDMAAGAATLASGVSKVTDPLEWACHPGENLERVKTALNAADALAKVASPVGWLTDPKGNLKTAGALWDGITHEYRQDARQGDWAKFAGRLVVDVGSFFIGAGEVKAAEKGAQAANAAAHLAEGANTAAHVVEGASKAAKTARGLNTVEQAAQEAVRLGDAAETVKAAGKMANELDSAVSSAGEVNRAAAEVAGLKKTTISFDDLAVKATRNPNSDKVILGKFLQDSKSYTKVGAHYQGSYFKLENWRELSKTLTQDELWKINEAFLRQQIKQGKKIIFSHDPMKATGFFAKEVKYLQSLGYRFEQNGWVWKAIR